MSAYKSTSALIKINIRVLLVLPGFQELINSFILAIKNSCSAEVRKFQHKFVIDEDIGGFDVSVDYAFVVQVLQPVDNIRCKILHHLETTSFELRQVIRKGSIRSEF